MAAGNELRLQQHQAAVAWLALVASFGSIMYTWHVDHRKQKEDLVLAAIEKEHGDYPTELISYTAAGPRAARKYVVIGLIWRMTLVNNGEAPVAITDYHIENVGPTGSISYRHLDQGFWGADFQQFTLPLNIDPHTGLSLLLKVGVLISDPMSARVLREHKAGRIALPSLGSFLEESYSTGTDLFGNRIRRTFRQLQLGLGPFEDRQFRLTLSTSKNTAVIKEFSWYGTDDVLIP